jgi:hypothetical protein
LIHAPKGDRRDIHGVHLSAGHSKNVNPRLGGNPLATVTSRLVQGGPCTSMVTGTTYTSGVEIITLAPAE